MKNLIVAAFIAIVITFGYVPSASAAPKTCYETITVSGVITKFKFIEGMKATVVTKDCKSQVIYLQGKGLGSGSYPPAKQFVGGIKSTPNLLGFGEAVVGKLGTWPYFVRS
jgi:hypothetical protein